MAVKPTPAPDDISRFYWDGARDGVLLVAQCSNGHLSHPPAPSCPHCGSRALEPHAVSGRGTVYSFTVVRQAFDEAFRGSVPYLVALVELPEQTGLRVLTNLLEVEPDDVEVGMPVELTFEARDGQSLPQFRPASAP
jgi:uncharacterized protein